MALDQKATSASWGGGPWPPWPPLGSALAYKVLPGNYKAYPRTEGAGDRSGCTSPCNYDDDDYKHHLGITWKLWTARHYLGPTRYYLGTM